MDNKKEKKAKLVLLSNQKVEKNNQITLTPEELELKSRLVEIENKIDSLENVIKSIQDDLPETFYSSEIFLTIIAGAALTAATKVVNEVFGIKDEDKEQELF